MSNCKKIRLSEIGHTITGKTPSSKCPDDFGDQYMFITPSDNFDSKNISKTQRYLSRKGIEKLASKKLPPKSILVSCIGSAMGKVVMNKTVAITNQQINSIIPNKDKFDNDYIYYLLKNNYSILRTAATGSTALPLLNKTDFDLLEVNIIENLPTQQKIAAVLSALDDKIELNNTINAELEAIAKTLYDYWFVQFEFPNSEGKPYKSSGGAMEYNAILKREIPKGWEVKTIGDYCKSTGGFAFKSSWWTNEGEAVIKIKDIQEDYTINLDDLSYVNLSDKIVDDKFKAKPGDVLIAMTGATIGKYAIVPITEKPLYVNQRVGYFNLGEKPIFKLPFFINSLNQSYFRETVFALASGAAQPNISNEQINNISLLFPEEEFIKMYNSKLYGCYKRILLNLKQNQELAQLRDWLLPMLMNGQVKVVDEQYNTVNNVVSMAAESEVDYNKGSQALV